MSLHFITGNQGKFTEVQLLIPEVQQIDIELDEIQELDPQKVIEHKLAQAAQSQSGEIMIEDTSLYIEGLNGLPGPFIKWFLKSLGTEGIAALTASTKNSRATAKTIIGYSRDGQEPQYFEGVIEGTIVAPRGELGFGWDAIFQPAGQTKTFGEMTREEKSEFSMRKLAVMKLKEILVKR